MGNQLVIVLDSSTSAQSGQKIGPSLCFWVAYTYTPHTDKHPISETLPESERYKNAILMEAKGLKPDRSGAIYNSFCDPITIFYDGIIQALDACFYLIDQRGVDEVLIMGDVEHVIRQLNGEIDVVKMKSMYNQVERLRKQYSSKGINTKFAFIREGDYHLYKKVDGLSKEIRSKIASSFG